MNQLMSEWVTKEELAKNCNMSLDEVERELPKLIDNNFIEEKNGSFKINESDGEDKAYGRIKDFLTTLDKKYPDEKYFPIIRHGYLHLKHKLSQKYDYPDEVKRLSKEVGYDLDNIDSSKMLNDAELFEIDNKTLIILMLTDNQIFERKLPYPHIVLDCNLNIDNIWFKGFFFTKETMWTYWGNTDGFCDNPLIIKPFNEEHDLLEKSFGDKLKKSTIRKIKVFICNFIDFLNNPEVKVIRFVRSKKNRERRIRDGKEPLPSANKIIVRGELKQYLEKLSESDFTYNYRFWVRGHYKRFWNKKRYNNLYDLLERNQLPSKYYVDNNIRLNDKIIMIWNKPFVKGSGVLISKRYEVKK